MLYVANQIKYHQFPTFSCTTYLSLLCKTFNIHCSKNRALAFATIYEEPFPLPHVVEFVIHQFQKNRFPHSPHTSIFEGWVDHEDHHHPTVFEISKPFAHKLHSRFTITMHPHQLAVNSDCERVWPSETDPHYRRNVFTEPSFQRRCHCKPTYPLNRFWLILVLSVACHSYHKGHILPKNKMHD